jgi:hypothetical protein
LLDFTALNNDLPKSPTSPGKDPANIKVPAELKSTPTAVAGAEYRGTRQKQTEKSLLELGKLNNERLGRCQMTIWEYNKAVRDDRPPEEIALLAARALSLAVGEELIYTSIEKKYRERYGIRTAPEPPHGIIKEK